MIQRAEDPSCLLAAGRDAAAAHAAERREHVHAPPIGRAARHARSKAKPLSLAGSTCSWATLRPLVTVDFTCLPLSVETGAGHTWTADTSVRLRPAGDLRISFACIVMAAAPSTARAHLGGVGKVAPVWREGGPSGSGHGDGRRHGKGSAKYDSRARHLAGARSRTRSCTAGRRVAPQRLATGSALENA